MIPKHTIPKTYFSTSLSESAKETENRIRNIFRGQRKRPAFIVLALTIAFAVLCGSLISVRSREGTAHDPAGEQEDVPSGQAREQEFKQAAAEAQQTREAVELPSFAYQGDEPYLPAVCDWMVAGAKAYDGGQVTIPCPLIAETDDSDEGDIRIWGDFRVNNYELRGTTLFSVSGGERPGLLHLRRTDNGYEVYDAEEVGDGEQYARDKLRIFGSARMKKLDSLDAEKARIQFVDDYVRRNSLPVTQVQDFGWPPIQLPSAPPTPDAAQGIHHVSPAGWSIDYDLREFSYDGYGGIQEVFTGVGDLQGISILIDYDSDADAGLVISELVEQMEQPIQKDVTIGVAGVPAAMLRDGTTRSEVIKDTYVVALPSGGCLTVTVRNTYYATFGDPIVPGADAVLQKTLATFRLVGDPEA